MHSPTNWTYIFSFLLSKILGFYSAFFKNRARTAWRRTFFKYPCREASCFESIFRHRGGFSNGKPRDFI